jgi:hypothetical protein
VDLSDSNRNVDEAQIESPDTVIDRLLPQTLSKLEEQITEGRTKTVRHKCSGCGKLDNIEVDTGADPELLIKAASMLSSAKARAKTGDDDASVAATKLLRDLSEMTNADLAEYISKLESELASA